MIKFVGLRAKTDSYLIDDSGADKKSASLHRKFIKKQKINIKNTERHNVLTEEINKIALSSNDDKRMQLSDSIETYAYGTRQRLSK